MRPARAGGAAHVADKGNLLLPQEFEGLPIPQILTSGDHAKIAAWRRAQSEELTQTRRPDLWAAKIGSKAPKNTTEG